MISVLLAGGMFFMMLVWINNITNGNYKGGYPGLKVEEYLLQIKNNTSNFFIVKSQITTHTKNSKTKFILEIDVINQKLRCYEYGNYVDSDNTKIETYFREKPFLLNYDFNNHKLSYLDNFFKTSNSKTNVEYFKVKDNDNDIKYVELGDDEKEKLENNIIKLLKKENLEKSDNKYNGTEPIFQNVKNDMHLDCNLKNSSFISSVNLEKYNFVYFNNFKDIVSDVCLIEVKELLDYPDCISDKRYLKKDFLIFKNQEVSICLSHVLSFSFKDGVVTFKFINVYLEDKQVELSGFEETEQKQIIDTIQQCITSSKNVNIA